MENQILMHKKLCYISNLYPPYVLGGAEINVEKAVKAMAKREDVFVITTKPFTGFNSLFAQNRERNGIKVYDFSPLNLYDVYSTKKKKIHPLAKIIWHVLDLWNPHAFLITLRILQREKPDIIHTSNLNGFSFSVFWAARILRIPLVHTLRDYHLLCPYANLMCPFTRFHVCEAKPLICRIHMFLKRIIVDNIPAVIIAPSKFTIDIHKQNGFFRKAVTKVIPNFIEREVLAALRRDKKATLDLLFIGRLSEVKGVVFLIKSFKTIKADFLRLHVIGEGPERNAVETLIGQDQRIIMHGERNRAGVEQIYVFVDILIIPSVCYDNFPTVTLEAFSWGIPVIGSDIGGIPEQIQNGYNGFLFSPGDAVSLKEKIMMFVNDFESSSALLNKMRGNALLSAEKYAKDKILDEQIKIYNSLSKRGHVIDGKTFVQKESA